MVADVRIIEGPGMIKSENGMLRSYVSSTSATATSWASSTRPGGSWRRK